MTTYWAAQALLPGGLATDVRLETADGDWAVKVPFATSTEDDVRSSTRFQEAAHTAGVPTPQVRRTTEGRVFATVQGEQARVHGWVDLEPPDPLLDPEAVGSLLAALHRLPTPAPGPAPLGSLSASTPTMARTPPATPLRARPS